MHATLTLTQANGSPLTYQVEVVEPIGYTEFEKARAGVSRDLAELFTPENALATQLRLDNAAALRYPCALIINVLPRA